ncbi:ABC transporter ATP-binding protein [Bacillus sp. FJAT-26390]|uniref:ABC transporter ATP-binding protein n=1 Tax=Bacillus sp. FJAT-26390 TaxID=1743142 RepID=UPI000807D8DF|nr:ATP-binding cassette domain-containing protein [Bacillus sp. FJAT-26390]OBZ16105.1 bacitracin ABC transporter ATP-binding protein [Bacillus sp. FJAT-26390]
MKAATEKIEALAVLSLKNVTKRIAGKTIVDRMSFDIHKGEIVGLLGPNGAGKTTTIRMIVGLIQMSEGDVIIQGHSIRNDFTKAIRHIGAIIENPEFYPYMTGQDNLKQYQRMSEGITDERIKEVVELVGLEAAMKKKVKAYSLGMRQRLGIAQALLDRPSLLILDEPTNGLDPAGIREMRQYLKQIADKEGISILVSSHLLSEMELMCSRVVVIQEGKYVTHRSLIDAAEPSQQITVAIRVDDAERAVKVAATIKGVEVAPLTSERNELLLALDNELIPQVVAKLGSEQIKIYRITETKLSLEDEFLKWTGGSRIA